MNTQLDIGDTMKLFLQPAAVATSQPTASPSATPTSPDMIGDATERLLQNIGAVQVKEIAA